MAYHALSTIQPRNSRIRIHAIAGLILAGLVVGMFGDVLFSSGSTILSAPEGDMLSQYVYLRGFCFEQLRQGHLPLWNPHLFCGVPGLAPFESALLYPLNAVYLFLPPAKAINFGIALHVFLLGYFTYLWTNYRGLHGLACVMCGAMAMFCGAHFGHVRAGHLSNLCTMPWIPLLFLAIDGFFDRRSVGWGLLGIGTIAMMALAGHPQYFYYSGIAAALYCGLQLIKARHRKIVMGGLIAMCAGGVALSAVQFITGIAATGESVRAGGVTHVFASMFSLPPENLLTLIAPFMLGDIGEFPYWGRCYGWEMIMFLSVTGMILALIACFHGDRGKLRFSIIMVLALLLLALGRHTPLFDIMYGCFPGFNKFRGCSKFFFQASLFLIVLAGVGLDYLIRGGRPGKALPIGILVAGALIAGAAWQIRQATLQDNGRSWAQVLDYAGKADEACLPREFYSAPDAIRTSGVCTSISLFVSAGTLALVGILLARLKTGRILAWILAILVIVEVATFARLFRSTCDLASVLSQDVVDLLRENPGDYRILNLTSPNSAMLLNVGDIWGYAPGVSKRYAEFMTFTQKGDMAAVSQYVGFGQPHKLYRMLRLRYVFFSHPNGIQAQQLPDALPPLKLLTNFTVATQRDQILGIMNQNSFDPAQQVILEQQPNPAPVSSTSPGSAKIIDSSTDHLTIEADIASPAILLVTNGYSKDWKVRPLPDSSQQQYELLPANYVLRAVPLAAGHHIFRMEYAPVAFTIGKWISIVSLIAFFAATAWWARRATPSPQ